MTEHRQDKHLFKVRDVVLPNSVALLKQLLYYLTANKPGHTSDRDHLGCVYRSHCARQYGTQNKTAQKRNSKCTLRRCA